MVGHKGYSHPIGMDIDSRKSHPKELILNETIRLEANQSDNYNKNQPNAEFTWTLTAQGIREVDVVKLKWFSCPKDWWNIQQGKNNIYFYKDNDESIVYVATIVPGNYVSAINLAQAVNNALAAVDANFSCLSVIQQENSNTQPFTNNGLYFVHATETWKFANDRKLYPQNCANVLGLTDQGVDAFWTAEGVNKYGGDVNINWPASVIKIVMDNLKTEYVKPVNQNAETVLAYINPDTQNVPWDKIDQSFGITLPNNPQINKSDLCQDCYMPIIETNARQFTSISIKMLDETDSVMVFSNPTVNPIFVLAFYKYACENNNC